MNLESEPIFVKIIAGGMFVLLALLVWQVSKIEEAIKETPQQTVNYLYTQFKNP